MAQYLIRYIVVFMIMKSLYASQPPSSLDLMIKTMNHCYEVENRVGTELAKCILAKMNKVNNPHGYKVIIKDKYPNKKITRPFSLIVYDKYGDGIICKGVAKYKIVFTNCIDQKINKYTPGKQLSIDPTS